MTDSRFGGPWSYEELTDPNGKWKLSTAQMIERERCVADPLYLASTVLYVKWDANLLDRPSSAHREVVAAMLAFRNFLYIDARGTAKTTLSNEVGAVWKLLVKPNATILLSHSVDSSAKGLSRSVRVHFESNEKLRALFPEYAMEGKLDIGNVLSWSVPCRTSGGTVNSVTAATPGKQITGLHFTDIMMTDWMNPETTPLYGRGSLEQMQSLVMSTSEIIGLLQGPEVCPWASYSLNSNRWHDADQAAWLKENNVSGELLVIERGVTMAGDGKTVVATTWPEVQTVESLQKKHDDAAMTEVMWRANFCSDPKPEGDISFLREKFHDYGKGRACEACGSVHSDPVGLKEVAVLVDPAFSDNKSEAKKTDRTGVVAAGFDVKGDMYVTNSRAGRWGPEEFVNNVFEMVALEARLDPNVWVGIEDTNGSRALRVMFEQRLKRERSFVMLRELKHGGKRKDTRIAPLHNFISRNGIFLRLPEDAELLNELLRWGVAKHDDLADALAYRALEVPWLDIHRPTPETPRLTSAPKIPKMTGADWFREMDEPSRPALMSWLPSERSPAGRN